jgi:hypothetical protein
VWDLGFQSNHKNANDYAVDQFNIYHAPNGYLILHANELKELVRLANKRLDVEGVF